MEERAIIEQSAGDRLALIPASYQRLTGKPLAESGQDLWTAPLAVVAHGTEPSPLFFYANRAALKQFKLTAQSFIGMESRFSAGEADRAERAAMFTRLQAANVVTDYAGLRVAGDGSQFRIENAVIWNLVDEQGMRRGQAAAFIPPADAD